MPDAGDELVRWDLFDTFVRDDEVTGDTRDAHVKALALARKLWGDGYAHKTAGAALRVLTPYGYVAEIRGQRSATAQGRHGAHPGRIAKMRDIAREMRAPVRMLFFEQSALTAYAVWLEAVGEPDLVHIADDPARKRQGWRCRDMERLAVGHRVTEEASRIVFPEQHPPLYNPHDAGRLM